MWILKGKKSAKEKNRLKEELPGAWEWGKGRDVV